MYENILLDDLAVLIADGVCVPEYSPPLRVGVDLGTANIVIVVVDDNNKPVAGVTYESKVVKDGVVVDYIGAIRIIEQLKKLLEERIGCVLENAAVAIPPGISVNNGKCMANVVESAGFQVTKIVDEPTAAATVLGIKNGAVVDVGGGTTGISIIKDGRVEATFDEPTGGIHMTLTIAGYYDIGIEDAEKLKCDAVNQDRIFPIVLPVIEKMAVITKNAVEHFEIDTIYLVGGASLFDEFERVLEKTSGKKTMKANQAMLVTPLGIAMSCV